MVLSFAINQGAPIQSSAGVPLESRGVVDSGCETSSASYTSATGNMMGGSRKSRRQHRSKKSSSRKDRKDRKDQRTKRGRKSRQQFRKRQQRHLNRTLKSQSRRSHKVDYEQEGGGASYTQNLGATESYGDAVGSQASMRAEVAQISTN